jgi:hypothetical protein
MPAYDFQHPKTGEVKEVILRMSEPHVYVDEEGTQWNRIFAVPQACVDGKINCWSQNHFVEKTKNAKGTVGDIWDRSRELSEKRAKEAGGIDPIRAKAEAEYSKKRKGRKYTPKLNDISITS